VKYWIYYLKFVQPPALDTIFLNVEMMCHWYDYRPTLGRLTAKAVHHLEELEQFFTKNGTRLKRVPVPLDLYLYGSKMKEFMKRDLKMEEMIRKEVEARRDEIFRSGAAATAGVEHTHS
jgi:hypothetical protein